MANWPPGMATWYNVSVGNLNFNGQAFISGHLRNLICKRKSYLLIFVYLCNSQCLPNYQIAPPPSTIEGNKFLSKLISILTKCWNAILNRAFSVFKWILFHKLEAQWVEPVSLTFHSALRKLNTEPSIQNVGVSHQVSVHLAKQFQRSLETNQPETRFACGSHVCKWIGANWAIFIEVIP